MDLVQKRIQLDSSTATKIANAFIVCHESSNDKIGTTRAAIACNSLKTQILNTYGSQICAFNDSTKTSLFYKAVYQGHSNTADRRLALFKPAPVWISGSSAQSNPTLCTIDGYLLKLPLYSIIEHKAVTLMNAELKRFKETKLVTYGTDDVAHSAFLHPKCFITDHSTHINDIHSIIGEDKNVISNAFIIALACLMHATVTQHMCDIDAGVKFRDKRGRQAAFDELHASLNTLLYATPYKAN